ncbi:MAG: LysR family transcriptional regulator [Myxococcales bacterium]|nr:LysR family transcriptional regulator [Myxococcales bacterium]
MLTSLRRNVWNWLPAFVEIAEAGSVVAAARRLALTPAAVSRTLGLLEDALGRPLFDRVGKRLVLTSAGVALRDAVRAATRAVETGLADGADDPFLGALRVASIGVLTDHVVVPALIELKRAHPGLAPEHAVVGPAEANALLVRGVLDVAFYYEELTSDEIAVERLGALGASIYCGRRHPLFGARRPTRAAVLAHPFSVPRVGDSGRVQDGWPAELARTVGMRITMLRSNLQVALSGTLLTVLPDVTAAPHLARRELRRLTMIALPPIEVFAARHRGALGRRAGQAMTDAARARLAAVCAV